MASEYQGQVPYTFESLIQDVQRWATLKGIDIPGNAHKQLLKATEEFGEMTGAFLKGNPDAIRDELGDVLVTLIIFARQNDLSLVECLGAAWDKIKGRTGKTIDGVFVKDGDIEP